MLGARAVDNGTHEQEYEDGGGREETGEGFEQPAAPSQQHVGAGRVARARKGTLC